MATGFERPKFNLNSQPKASAQANPTKTKDFWTDQISTGGGIAGSLAGAAGGAALGSVVPGVGTVIGGLLGGILGGAGGSAAGQVGENVITGEKDVLKDVGSEALMGGLLSAPPIRATKGLIAGGKVLLGAGENLAGATVKNAFEQAFLKPGIISTAGKNLVGNIASKTYSNAFTVPRKLATQLNPEQVSKELMQYGISGSLDKIGKTSNNVMSTLGKVVDNSVSGIGGQIKIGDPIEVANNALKGVAINKIDRKALMSELTDIGASGTLPGYASPSSLMETARTLEKKGFARINAGNSALNPNPTSVEIGNAYIQAAKEIEDNIYKQVNSAGSLKGLQTPEMAKQLNSMAKGLGDKFLAAKSVGEVRSLMSPFVRANKLIGLTEDQALSAGTQGLGGMTGRIGGAGVGFGLGGVPGAVGGFLAEPVIAGATQASKAPIATNVGRGLNMAANAITPSAGSATRGVLPTAASQIIGRQAFGQPQTTAPMGQTTSAQGSSLFSQQISGQSQPQSDMTTGTTSQSPYPREALLYDMQRDPQNADKYMAYYKQFEELYPTAAAKTFSSAAAGTMSDFQSSLNELNNLTQEIATGKGTVDPIFGRIRSLNPYDVDQQTLQAMIDKTRQIVGKALEGGVLRKEDEEKYKRILPTTSDTKEVALNKIQMIKSQLGSKLQDYSSLVGGGTSIEDVLINQSNQGAY